MANLIKRIFGRINKKVKKAKEINATKEFIRRESKNLEFTEDEIFEKYGDRVNSDGTCCARHRARNLYEDVSFTSPIESIRMYNVLEGKLHDYCRGTRGCYTSSNYGVMKGVLQKCETMLGEGKDVLEAGVTGRQAMYDFIFDGGRGTVNDNFVKGYIERADNFQKEGRITEALLTLDTAKVATQNMDREYGEIITSLEKDIDGIEEKTKGRFISSIVKPNITPNERGSRLKYYAGRGETKEALRKYALKLLESPKNKRTLAQEFLASYKRLENIEKRSTDKIDNIKNKIVREHYIEAKEESVRLGRHLVRYYPSRIHDIRLERAIKDRDNAINKVKNEQEVATKDLYAKVESIDNIKENFEKIVPEYIGLVEKRKLGKKEFKELYRLGRQMKNINIGEERN